MKTLVFAGGNGTRLWPISRIKSPKQFQKLINDKSLFELTIDRLLKKFELDDIYVVIPQIYYDSVKSFYPNIKDENIIIEPFKWDTLSCIGYAAFVLSKKFPNENVFITWSDGYIEDEEKFMEMITVGDSYATQNNKIIRIGAKVTFPSVNLGYIQISDELKRVNDVKVYQYVHQFEKPELEIAKKFFASSDYLWNTGYMIWPLDKLIDAYRMHSPISFEILEKIADPGFLGSI